MRSEGSANGNCIMFGTSPRLRQNASFDVILRASVVCLFRLRFTHSSVLRLLVYKRIRLRSKLSLSGHLIPSQHGRLFRNGIIHLCLISWAYPSYILKSLLELLVGSLLREYIGGAANVFGEVLIVLIRVNLTLFLFRLGSMSAEINF